ncbi:MAG: malonyl-[acyl-carrier protein] O-methyltransferase BioC [Gammaproteobacteria bacterium HGW-Gammaproteobacteria-10]|nr:MAG: malonyl-[acyl-carrier protein] O-methyltransferase BioC [Gammaproteobacteria bacterium HGW-Gammaproteobacteria-10]
MSAVFELDKTKLRESFGSASHSYDRVAGLQRQVGWSLLQQAAQEKLSGVVVDLGCGTGFLTQALLNAENIALIVALDIALPMLKAAREKLGDEDRLHYICGDAESPPLNTNSVDTVVSNLALQWCRDLTSVFSGLHGILKPGGELAFSTFGPQTLRELKRAWAEVDDYHHVNEFYRETEIRHCLSNAGFKEITVQSEIYRPVYGSVMDLMKELKSMGAHNVSSGRNKRLTTKQEMTRMIEAYPLNGAEIEATFEVFIVSARVENND